jgi:hypothetical protein
MIDSQLVTSLIKEKIDHMLAYWVTGAIFFYFDSRSRHRRKADQRGVRWDRTTAGCRSPALEPTDHHLNG